MMRRALTNTGWLMSARGVNAVLSIVYLALATRALGLEEFGQFVIAFTFAQLIVSFAGFQTWQVIVQWGQEAEARKSATGFALALDAASIIVGAGAAALILGLAGDWLPIPPELRPMTFAFTLVSLLAIRSTPTGLLRLHDKYARAAAADATTSIVRAVGAAAVALTAPSIEGFLIVWGLAELATAAMYWRLAAQTEPIHWRSFSFFRLPREQNRAWRFVFGTSLSASVSAASRKLLVLLVGVFGGAAMAGIYRVAAQLGEGLLKLAQALLRAVYPELVRDPQQAAALTRQITRLAIITGIAVVVLALLAGEWLVLAIAGSAFLAAYWPMAILSGAAALELAGASFEALLVARGKAMLTLALRGIPTVIGLAALPWLIDWLGAVGAAVSVLLISVASVAGFALATREVRPQD